VLDGLVDGKRGHLVEMPASGTPSSAYLRAYELSAFSLDLSGVDWDSLECCGGDVP